MDNIANKFKQETAVHFLELAKLAEKYASLKSLKVFYACVYFSISFALNTNIEASLYLQNINAFDQRWQIFNHFLNFYVQELTIAQSICVLVSTDWSVNLFFKTMVKHVWGSRKLQLRIILQMMSFKKVKLF